MQGSVRGKNSLLQGAN